MTEIKLGSVFIVDDEKHIRTAIEQLLELENYEVRSFASAKELLVNIEQGCPDVIISDINMPVMDGHQLMANVFQIDRELPIILLTGFGDISMAVNSIKNGAYDFIEKPFNNDHLLDRVKRAIDKRTLTLENRSLKKTTRRAHFTWT